MKRLTQNIFYNILMLILFTIDIQAFALPTDFVYLSTLAPHIQQDIRYNTSNNFIGRPINGYEYPYCILSKEAALALAKIQQKLQDIGLGLKVYDCYRPQSAVNDFIAWSQTPDNKMKNRYYPHINKSQVFKLGYVAEQSGHSRGSTVDLTLIHQVSGKELNMGTHFDYLDQTSHPFSALVSKQAKHNRLFLRKIMLQAGFRGVDTEWWHFTLKNEPFPQTFFNFPVE